MTIANPTWRQLWFDVRWVVALWLLDKVSNIAPMCEAKAELMRGMSRCAGLLVGIDTATTDAEIDSPRGERNVH